MKTNNVLVNNLCSWPLSFRRMAGQGDIEIPGNARNFPLLSEEEVLAQIQTGNVMFTGTDNMGSHARIQIVILLSSLAAFVRSPSATTLICSLSQFSLKYTPFL